MTPSGPLELDYVPGGVSEMLLSVVTEGRTGQGAVAVGQRREDGGRSRRVRGQQEGGVVRGGGREGRDGGEGGKRGRLVGKGHSTRSDGGGLRTWVWTSRLVKISPPRIVSPS